MDKCVNCGHKKFKTLYKLNSGRIDFCLNCKLVVSRVDSKVNYENYHRDTDYNLFENMFKNIFMKRFNIISKYKANGKVLDIGCSTGAFLEIFKEKGWETWGVEPSRSADIAVKKGIKVVKSNLENAKLPLKYFDVIILNHTLEHSENPTKFLKVINNLLKKDGILFIDVPNFGSLSSQLMGKRWPYLLPIEHNYQFTKDTLIKLVRKTGYKEIYTESRSGIFEFANPLKELIQSLVPPKKRFLSHAILFPYDLLSTLLSMGDSMSVIAEKV